MPLVAIVISELKSACTASDAKVNKVYYKRCFIDTRPIVTLKSRPLLRCASVSASAIDSASHPPECLNAMKNGTNKTTIFHRVGTGMAGGTACLPPKPKGRKVFSSIYQHSRVLL